MAGQPLPAASVLTSVTPTAQAVVSWNRLFLCLLLGRAGVNRKFEVILSAEGIMGGPKSCLSGLAAGPS